MIYVPMPLFIATVVAKCLTIVKGVWQVRCTRLKGYPVLPLSGMYIGVITTGIGIVYYGWMREPVGILGHCWTMCILMNNIYYKVKYHGIQQPDTVPNASL